MYWVMEKRESDSEKRAVIAMGSDWHTGVYPEMGKELERKEERIRNRLKIVQGIRKTILKSAKGLE